MYQLKYVFENNIPLFSCNFCGHCSGFIESKSLIHIKNRGCCWYFPKYTLMDIRNILILGREDFIHNLFALNNTKVSNFYIEVNGFFDKNAYEKYEGSEEFDTRLFFRVCPFFDKNGCGIDFKLRPHPCNLYLCREVIEFAKDKYKLYSKERIDYYSYMNYYNEQIKQDLRSKRVDLLSDNKLVLDLLKGYNIPQFEPRKLDTISLNKNETVNTHCFRNNKERIIIDECV